MNIGELTAVLGVDTRGLSKANQAMRGFEKNSRASFQRTNTAAKSLQKTFIAFGGAFAVTRMVSDIVKVGATYEQTMATVQGVSRATAEEQAGLIKITKELGESTEWTASQAGDAAKFLSMAGFKANQTIAALPGVMDLATAGSVDLGRAADIASNALTSMQMPVSQLGKVNDVFVKGITTANMDMNMLAESFKYAGSIGATYGYSIEQITGYIGQLGNAGIQGSMAGTQMAVAFQKVSSVFAAYGVQAGKGQKYTNDLTGALHLLEDRGASADKIMKLFGQRAGRGVAALLGNGTKALKEYTDGLNNAEGASKALADIMRDTTTGAYKEMQSAIEGVKIDIFTNKSGDLKEMLKIVTAKIRENKDSVLTFANAIGNVIKFIVQWSDVIFASVKAFLAYKIAIFAVNKAIILYQGILKAAAVAMRVYNVLVTRGALLIKMMSAATKASIIGVIVAAITAAIVIWKKFHKEVSATQQMMGDVAKEAKKSIIDEKVELQNLLRTARDENVSLEKRKEAIDELNKISPKYLGNLNLANIATDEARRMTDAYTAALLTQARIEAIIAQQKALEAKKLDIETKSVEETLKWYQKILVTLVQTQGVMTQSVAEGMKIGLAAKNQKDELDEITTLQKELNLLLSGELGKQASVTDAVIATGKELDKNQKKAQKIITSVTPAKMVATSPTAISKDATGTDDIGLADMTSSYAMNLKAYQKYQDDMNATAQQANQERLNIAIETMGSISNVIGNLSGLYTAQKDAEIAKVEDIAKKEKKSQEWLSKEKEKINREHARKEKETALAMAFVNIAEGVTKAFAQGGILGFISAAAITAAGALQIATIQAQGLATGGSVYKSGAFMVGEKGPEMVSLPAGAAVTPNHALNNNTNLSLTTSITARELKIMLNDEDSASQRFE